MLWCTLAKSYGCSLCCGTDFTRHLEQATVCGSCDLGNLVPIDFPPSQEGAAAFFNFCWSRLHTPLGAGNDARKACSEAPLRSIFFPIANGTKRIIDHQGSHFDVGWCRPSTMARPRNVLRRFRPPSEVWISSWCTINVFAFFPIIKLNLVPPLKRTRQLDWMSAGLTSLRERNVPKAKAQARIFCRAIEQEHLIEQIFELFLNGRLLGWIIKAQRIWWRQDLRERVDTYKRSIGSSKKPAVV
mmetsp:Transcript_16529/g.37856  ORF Transcript_16529/g.37856 Transcript_16529/m.37856 type:complete len:243 (-) Transcript_16529:732-1460(-)